VPQISDCAVIYASTIVHPQLASTASSSTSTDSYKQASKQVRKYTTLDRTCRKPVDLL